MHPAVDLHAPLTEADIDRASARLAGVALRTPLVAAQEPGVHLKLETLQPSGAYKIRSGVNTLKARLEAEPAMTNVVTASAGNAGRAMAFAARALGLPISVHVPEDAARVKIEGLRRLGATVRLHPYQAWWSIMQTRETGEAGCFLHPVCERDAFAGSGTIGREILEDLPAVERVYVPIGGGGLAVGIAQAVKLRRPEVRIVGVECETATPLTEARAQGGPVVVTRVSSFIDGMGSTRVLDEMWPLLSRWIDETIIVSVAEIRAAIRDLALAQHVVAEGAGAAAYAAARRRPGGASVAIVSGGNIDPSVLAGILSEGG